MITLMLVPRKQDQLAIAVVLYQTEMVIRSLMNMTIVPMILTMNVSAILGIMVAILLPAFL